MEEFMYYTIYKITNEVNGKIYIGSHKTKHLDDNYMGSGKYLKRAIEKLGIENFSKEILFVFDNPAEMYAKEAELVNEEFIAERNTYNLKVGGFGGWDYINSRADRPNNSREHMKMMSDAVCPEVRKRSLAQAILKHAELLEANGGKAWWTSALPFLGKTHTEETKAKMRAARADHGQGEKNSQFGTMWITNGTENKKIKKSSDIPEGWSRGRKMIKK
jgi:group I intron endonuclease